MAGRVSLRYKIILRGLAVLMLLLMVFLVLGVSFVSYTASASLFFGTCFAWLGTYISANKQIILCGLKNGFQSILKSTNNLDLYGLILSILISIGSLYFSITLLGNLPYDLSLYSPYFDYYKLVIKPETISLEEFTINEYLIQERPIASSHHEKKH